jgi:hypothetical protein
MKQLTHRIAFNCDLFLDIDAPEDATSEDLEKLVIAKIRKAADDPNSDINEVGLNGLDINNRLDGARIYPRVTPDRDLDGGSVLENFTIENVSEVQS